MAEENQGNLNLPFIKLFFSKENDCLRFPLFFCKTAEQMAEIKGHGGFTDFSDETLQQMLAMFDQLKNCDLEQFQPERTIYLDSLKQNNLKSIEEYVAEYDRLENDLFHPGNRVFAAEYFSRLSEIAKQLSFVNGYLNMFSFSVANFLKLEELELTIQDLRQYASAELADSVKNLESLLESEKVKNQALQNALALQYGMKPSLTLAEKVTIINSTFAELGRIFTKDSFTSRTIQNWDNGKCPYNGYSSLYNAIELKAWCNKIIAEIRLKEQIKHSIRGMSDEEMSRKAKKC